MSRRALILFLAAAPLFAAAQGNPTIGFLRNTSAEESKFLVEALRKGLAEGGYAEKKNLTIEYRFADGKHERMPSLASDLVRRRVSVIVSGGTAAMHAARDATSTIPVVFVIGEDPKKMGMVDSLSRPSGNMTGTSFFELAGKRLEIFHALIPKVKTFAYLANPADPGTSTLQSDDVHAAARTLGLKLVVFTAKDESEITQAFANIEKQRIRAVHVQGGALFLSKREQIVSLALRQGIPVSLTNREGAEVGALFSYGASTTEAYRQAGVYVSRILKGAKTSDLPVIQSAAPYLVINLKTAKKLGITVPPPLLQRADAVIQ